MVNWHESILQVSVWLNLFKKFLSVFVVVILKNTTRFILILK